jgi:hypothetical protein
VPFVGQWQWRSAEHPGDLSVAERLCLGVFACDDVGFEQDAGSVQLTRRGGAKRDDLVQQKSCVPVDCYDEVLVIEEFERNKPGAYQLKYYAPGVGDIRVGWRGPEEEEKEGLELVKDVSLSPQGVAKARAGALELEKHAYEIKEYFGKTQPAKPTL